MEISRDQRIGENIAAYREPRSQEWLAEQMRSRGHEKWSQSTVWSVEKGKRPIRFTEAADLVQILGLRYVEDLMRTKSEAVLSRTTADLKEAGRKLRDAAAAYDQVYDYLNRVLFLIEAGRPGFYGAHVTEADFGDVVEAQDSPVFQEAEGELAQGFIDLLMSDELGVIRSFAGKLANYDGDPRGRINESVLDLLRRRRIQKGLEFISESEGVPWRYECPRGHWRVTVLPVGVDGPEEVDCGRCDLVAKHAPRSEAGQDGED